jgi:hypothetical protein
MAKILTFHPGELRRDESGVPGAGATAEVIVFPGVRYERWDEASEQPRHESSAKKQARDRHRDVLELAE